jgi:hypothetical protein
MIGARRVAKIAVGAIGLAVVAVACDGGDGLESARSAACPLLDRLGQAGQIVERADVADPDEFAAALDDAVAQYVSAVSKLRPLVPEELQDDLDRLEAAVRRHDFEAAVAARSALDDYAELECQRTTSTSTNAAQQ